MQAGSIFSVNEAIIDVHSLKKLLTIEMIQGKATGISIRVKSLPCFLTPDVV